MNEFKVGDWVRNKYDGKITKCRGYINNDLSACFINCGINNYEFQLHVDNVEPWQPKEGEWCWFKKRTELTPNVCELIRFYFDNSYISDCEPFFGELPWFLKESK